MTDLRHVEALAEKAGFDLCGGDGLPDKALIEKLHRFASALQPMQADTDAGRWLVFDVGCLECSVPSKVVGTYTTESEAVEVAGLLKELPDYNEGDHDFLVCDLNTAPPAEYAEAIAAAAAQAKQ